MLERLSDRAQKVMAYANLEANRLGSDRMGTEHLLLGLMREGKGNGAAILKALKVDLAEMAAELERSTPKNASGQTSKRPAGSDAKAALEMAAKEADRLGDSAIGTEHLLMGLAGVSGCPACRALAERGVSAGLVGGEIGRRRAEGGGGGVRPD